MGYIRQKAGVNSTSRVNTSSRPSNMVKHNRPFATSLMAAHLLAEALAEADGNRTEAAKSLGVSRMTIHRWIRRYGLDPDAE